MGYRWCSAINCSNNSGQKANRSFFLFPKDPERCKKWIMACRRKDLSKRSLEYLSKNCRLCSDHFEDGMFLNNLKNRLYSHAIPTIFQVANSTSPKQQSERKPPNKRSSQDTMSSASKHQKTSGLENKQTAVTSEACKFSDHSNVHKLATTTKSTGAETTTKSSSNMARPSTALKHVKEIPQTTSKDSINTNPELYDANIPDSEASTSLAEDSDRDLEETEVIIPSLQQAALIGGHLRSSDSEPTSPAPSSSSDDVPQTKRKRPSPNHVSVYQISAEEVPPIILPRKSRVKLPPLQKSEVTSAQPLENEIEEQAHDEEDSNQDQPQRTVQTQTDMTSKKPLMEFSLPAVQNSNKKESPMAQEEYEKRIKELENENKELKNQVEHLRNQTTTLEAELLKIFNRDQLRWIHNPNSRKSTEWSEATLLKSYQLRHMIGPKGYNFLRHVGFPFPSDTTVIKKAEKDGFDPSVCEELFLLCKKTGR